MAKELTNSNVDRQNILNNTYAIVEIQKAVSIKGVLFENKYVFLKEQIAGFFEVTTRTIDNYLSEYIDELSKNGYEVLRGKRLSDFKLALKQEPLNEINFVKLNTPQLGIFDFRALLNIAMLIVESERARLLRRTILDIVIDTINTKTGGATKYINQRDEDFVHSWFAEENYRKQFTYALSHYVEMGNVKYPFYTNKIYVSLFKEKANEYREILKLSSKDKLRDTLYSEVLDLVSSYECGFADMLAEVSKSKGRKLSVLETDQLFRGFESQAHWKPLIEKARIKMASRDLAFRDALHLKLKEYIRPLQAEEFERFIGEKSKDLRDRLEETKDVMKRLKERG